MKVRPITQNEIDEAERAISHSSNPEQAGYYLVIKSTTGKSNEYLSSIVSPETIKELKMGQSVLIHSPTGSGKTKVTEQIAEAFKGNQTLILTNRTVCKIQMLKDLCKKFLKRNDIPDDLLDNIKLPENLKCMTYQELIYHSYFYQNKNMLLILDECHCLAEDSTFSTYPQQITDFLKKHINNTIRIYMTATPDDVLPILWDIEKDSGSLHGETPLPLTMETSDYVIRHTLYNFKTKLQHIYRIPPNWNYLKFRIYNPNDKEKLIEYIRTQNREGRKALIFINDINKGKEMQEQLGDSQFVYADEEKKSELYQIAVQEQFDSDSLITTKVAENGVSLHDKNLSVIVAETWDLISLQQIIGRARVNCKNPHEIEVLIPDYSSSDLGHIEGNLYIQLKKFQKVIENPDFAMQYQPQPNPYIYYDAILKKPVVNHTGYNQIQKQIDFIKSLKESEQENPHAFIRKVLEIYGKDTDIIDEIFIDYDITKDCKQRILSAWEVFKESTRDSDSLKELKKALKEACNETSAYSKELKSNIQIDTINDILKFAGINERILPERRIFDTEQI